MGNSEPPASTSALDLMLKYSAAFFAVAYALGFVEHLSFAETVGAGAVSARLADSNYFLHGIVLEVVCGFGSVAAILSLEILNRAFPLVLDRPAPNWAQHLHQQTYRLSIIGIYVIVAFGMMLIIGGLSISLSFRWTVALALACAMVNLMVSAILLNPDAYVSSTVRQQLAMLMFVGIGLAVFSFAFGIAEGRKILRHPERGVRLLIAPDAIDGLKRLGIVFPDANNGGASAEPTETVSVLYRGESMWVLRTKDGRVVQIKSDKVWSVASEP